MRWIAKTENPKSIAAVIEHKIFQLGAGETMDGFYLYIYKNGQMTHDHLQDTLEIAKLQAFEDFGIPIDVWMSVEEGSYNWSAKIMKGSTSLQCSIYHDLIGGYSLSVSEDHVPLTAYWKNKRYRQSSLEEIKKVAFEDYGVPLDAWK